VPSSSRGSGCCSWRNIPGRLCEFSIKTIIQVFRH
jgi:hypothetical protein